MLKIEDRTLKLAAKGDLSGIKDLLSDEPQMLNAVSGGHNRTLLWEATNTGRSDVVSFLLEAGADPNIPGRRRHETMVLVKPYCIAVTKKREEIASRLLEHGTEIDPFTAAYLGQIDLLKRLLAKTPRLVNLQQPEEAIWQVTPLHHAVAGMQVEATECLLKAGADVAEHARLLLDIACRRTRVDLIKILVKAGAEPGQAEAFPVVRSNSREIIDFFFTRGCSVKGALTHVCRGDKGEHPEWVDDLLRHGADVGETDDKGRTALHNAARAGFAKVIGVLLAAEADVNARMKSGETPLALAVKKNRHEAAELLRTHGGVM